MFFIGPEKTLDITYASDKEVKLGNELTPKQVINPPTVKYNAENNSFYTLIMTDPDAPSRKNPKAREWHHWLVSTTICFHCMGILNYLQTAVQNQQLFKNKMDIEKASKVSKHIKNHLQMNDYL